MSAPCHATLGGEHDWGSSDCLLCGTERPPQLLRRSTRNRRKRSLSPDEDIKNKNEKPKKKLTKKQELLKHTLLKKTEEIVIEQKEIKKSSTRVNKTVVKRKLKETLLNNSKPNENKEKESNKSIGHKRKKYDEDVTEETEAIPIKKKSDQIKSNRWLLLHHLACSKRSKILKN